MLKLQNPDKKAVSETRDRILECERKIAILKYSLEKRMFEQQQQNALDDESLTLTVPSVDIVQIAAQGATLSPDTSMYRKADPLTGALKIQVLGCQGVLTCIPLSSAPVKFGSGTDSREESQNSSKASRVLKGSNKEKSRKSSEAKENDRSGVHLITHF